MGSSKPTDVLLKVGDKVNKPVKETTENIKLLSVHTQLASNQMATCSESTNKMKENMDNLIQFIAQSIMKFTKEGIESAHTKAINDSVVTDAIKEKTNATQKQVDSIFKQIYKQQNNGVVSDTVQKAGVKKLAEYVNSVDSIKTLIPAMNDLLVAKKQLKGTTSDADKIASAIGLAIKGNTEGLENAGIVFSDTDKQGLKDGDENEKIEIINRAIYDKVGNYNEKMSLTDSGAIQKAVNQFQAIKITLGEMVLPYLVKYAKWFSDHQPQIKKFVKTIGKIVIIACETIFNVINKIFEFAEKHPKLTKFLIVSLVMFIILKNTIMACIDVISTITFILGLLGIAFEISPVLIFVAAIGALIMVIALLITFWDEITSAVKNFFDMLEEKFPFLSKIMPGMEILGDLLIKTGHPILGTIIGFGSKLGIDQQNNKKKSKNKLDNEKLTNYVNQFGKNRDKHMINDFSFKMDEGEKTRRKKLKKTDWKSALEYIDRSKSEKGDLFKSLAIPANKSKKVIENRNVTFGNVYITAKGVTTKEVVNEIVPQLKLRLANM